jgi:hypothetical protein
MNRRIGLLLVGAAVGVLAAGPGMSRSEAGTGPATIRINDLQLALTRVDIGTRGTSPGDVEVTRVRLSQRGTGTVLGRGELICTFADGIRSRVCRGTYILPRGKLVVGGSLLYRRFYELAVVGGTGLYDNARGTLTVTRTHTGPVRDLLVFRLVG